MHETSLVRTLLDQVEELCAAHGGVSAREVRVEVGPLSGVEPLLLAAAFDRLRDGSTACTTASLRIDEVPLEVGCLTCGHVFQLTTFKFRCAMCSSDDTEIVRGDGVLLESVLLNDCTQGTII